MPSTHFSHSSLGTYRQCPQRYKFQYIEKVEIPRRLFAHFYLGTTVHRELRTAYEWAADGKLYSAEDMLASYRAAWEGDAARKIVSANESRTVEDYFAVGERMLIAYHQKYQPFNQATLFVTEKRWDFSLPGSPAIFRAQLDRVLKTGDNKYEICDYKTSAQPANGPTDPNFVNQMGMYQLAFEQTFPQMELGPPREIEVVQHYLRPDEIIRYRFRPDEIDELAERFRTETAEIRYAVKMDQWTAREGGYCRWCDFASICPAQRHRLRVEAESEDEPMTDAVQAAQLTDKYLELYLQKKALEAELNALKEDLVTAARQLEVTKLEGDNGKVAVSIKAEEKLPTKTSDETALIQLSALVKSWGDEMEPCFALDARELLNLYKKGRLTEEQVEDLRQFLIIKEAITVRAYPKKSEDLDPEK